jgi:hypothetical protein
LVWDLPRVAATAEKLHAIDYNTLDKSSIVLERRLAHTRTAYPEAKDDRAEPSKLGKLTAFLPYFCTSQCCLFFDWSSVMPFSRGWRNECRGINRRRNRIRNRYARRMAGE